jgi:hypothetical protein
MNAIPTICLAAAAGSMALWAGAVGAADLDPTADVYPLGTRWVAPERLEKGAISGFIGWSFNAPLGSVQDFTGNLSPLGFELQFRSWVSSNLSLGVSGDWVGFVDDRPRSTYSLDNLAVTATSYNRTQTASARFLVHYYLLDSGVIRPYVGPNVGIGWSAFDVEAANLVLSDNDTSIVYGVEGGAAIVTSQSGPIILANLRYSVLPSAEFQSSVSNVQTLGLLVGMGF